MGKANNILFYFFMLVVVLAPLPLGSNREWSWTLCAMLIGGIAILHALSVVVSVGAGPSPGS